MSRASRALRRSVAALIRALLAGAVLAHALGAQTPPGPLIINFANVGQGDAALVITPERRHILVDAGPSARAMERMFFESVYDTLDLVIASHAHADHIGGMPWVFTRFVVRAYMDNGIPHTTGVYRRTMTSVEREPGLQYVAATERTITVGSVTLRILAPPLLDSSHNNNSIGVVLEMGRFRAILTGDSEHEQLEHWLRIGKASSATIVKAAHHGAWNGATAEWIRATAPAAVVISVGARNRYGHPSPVVVRGWEAVGARVYRTDRDGSVIISAMPDGRFNVLTDANVLSVPLRIPE